ncbi:MAG TPA: nucleotide exchange factor GrpE [Chthoniobacteraceae bacterium]|jgi:molecular chaperone GrpE (heat shock protein)
MSQHDELPDLDFDAQLRGLFQEAELVIEGKSATDKRLEEQRIYAEKDLAERLAAAIADMPSTPQEPPPQNAAAASPVAATEELAKPAPAGGNAQMMRPVVLGLEALTRATGENTTILQKLNKSAGETVEAQKVLPQLVADLQTIVDQKNKVNLRMFDALHEELKGYKDGFLLESVHRPIIRDLITLYDDLAELQRQMAAAVHGNSTEVSDPQAGLVQRMRTMEMNMEHHLEFIIEVLARLEVTQLPVGEGKLDKKTQRAVAVEMAEDPDEDADIVRTVKRGFLWKERVLRAEEVVIKKWKEGFLVALAPTSQI